MKCRLVLLLPTLALGAFASWLGAATLASGQQLAAPVAQVELAEGDTVVFLGDSITHDGLEFTWQADALPLVVPDEAKLGAEILQLGHRFSQESLEIHDLPDGLYQLVIDGREVGEYRSTELERHVELQGNEKTPEYQQALEVAMLNKQRNDGPVKQLRNEWGVFQQHARLARQFQDKPGDAPLKEQVDAVAQKLVGLEERIAKHEQAAREIEDRIFEVNQPKPRKFALRKAKKRS